MFAQWCSSSGRAQFRFRFPIDHCTAAEDEDSFGPIRGACLRPSVVTPEVYTWQGMSPNTRYREKPWSAGRDIRRLRQGFDARTTQEHEDFPLRQVARFVESFQWSQVQDQDTTQPAAKDRQYILHFLRLLTKALSSWAYLFRTTPKR